MTDAILTSPVVAGGRVYVVDASGVAAAIDATTFKRVWTYESRGGAANCNNVSSPALAGKYLHFGTMAGSWIVLNAADGSLVRELRVGEPSSGHRSSPTAASTSPPSARASTPSRPRAPSSGNGTTSGKGSSSTATGGAASRG
jgi:outer membrane protein assembly factor BamB